MVCFNIIRNSIQLALQNMAYVQMDGFETRESTKLKFNIITWSLRVQKWIHFEQNLRWSHSFTFILRHWIWNDARDIRNIEHGMTRYILQILKKNRPTSTFSHLYKLPTWVITKPITKKLDFYQQEAWLTKYPKSLIVKWPDCFFRRLLESIWLKVWVLLESLVNVRIDLINTNILKNK